MGQSGTGLEIYIFFYSKSFWSVQITRHVEPIWGGFCNVPRPSWVSMGDKFSETIRVSSLPTRCIDSSAYGRMLVVHYGNTGAPPVPAYPFSC